MIEDSIALLEWLEEMTHLKEIHSVMQGDFYSNNFNLGKYVDGLALLEDFNSFEITEYLLFLISDNFIWPTLVLSYH